MHPKAAEAKPLMLSTQEMLGAYWPQVAPLLASAPIAEEFPPDAILKAALAGQMFVFVVKEETLDGPLVKLVVVLAPVPSDTLPVMTIVTVAGTSLRKFVRMYWDFFKGWCYMNGARAIDAYVPDRMEGFMEKELGLKRETVHVRLRL